LELKNKKINFLGDSITEGVGVSCEEHIYLNILKKEAGLAEARNYGISGTRIAAQLHPEHPDWDQDFISRVETMEDDADAVVVFGGTNDYGHGDAPLGDFSDRTPYTFYGACHVLLEKLIQKYPSGTIVVMTPLHRLGEEDPKGDGSKAVGTAPLSVYVGILKEVAQYYAVPVLDLYAVSGIQPCVPVLQERFCPDGLHPNDEGHKRIAARLKGFLQTL